MKTTQDERDALSVLLTGLDTDQIETLSRLYKDGGWCSNSNGSYNQYPETYSRHGIEDLADMGYIRIEFYDDYENYALSRKGEALMKALHKKQR